MSIKKNSIVSEIELNDILLQMSTKQSKKT
jgi:hypothetical protein